MTVTGKPDHLVYMDHAATTPLRPAALAAMMPYLTTEYGNPSSAYGLGRAARRALDEARDMLADLLDCAPGELVFTSGGTEANNLAIAGTAAASGQARHALVSAIEHPSVRVPVRYLAEGGWTIEELPVDAHGMVDPSELGKRLRADTGLVAVMHANNEVGTVEPVPELAALCAEKGVHFHTDAVQTVGHLAVRCREWRVSTLSFSAHKFGGPKGMGALYIAGGYKLPPLLRGGGQEQERRAGTENVAGIVGMAAALQEAWAEMPAATTTLRSMAAALTGGLRAIPGTLITGHPEHKLPGFVHACFADIDGETLLANLDRYGLAASGGAACSSGAHTVSAALIAMGIPPALAKGALRLTLGPGNRPGDVDYALSVIPEIVHRLRAGREPHHPL